jgi:transposase-like protein
MTWLSRSGSLRGMKETEDLLHIGMLIPPCATSGCAHERFIKKGFYRRACDSKRVQKFRCLDCCAHFSAQTARDDYRMRTVRRWPELRRALCSGTSRRRCALNFRMGRSSIERALRILAVRAARAHEEFLRTRQPETEVQFDEMETSEHTKWKPLSLPLVVSPERFILGIGVCRRSYKGPDADKALEKYGPRPDFRKRLLERLLSALPLHVSRATLVTTDQEPMYPGLVKTYFPNASHATTPGGRGCIAGYGELKRKAWDPMFPLNHTAASLRDGLATLKRRTWTTSKKPSGLLPLLMLYADYHNTVLVPPALERKQRLRERRLAVSKAKALETA